MWTLPVNVQHQYDQLALYVQSEGKLTDAYSVSYQVFDDSAGYPGTQVLPGAGAEAVTVTGKFATGCYGVYDSSTQLPWVPASPIARGRVLWRYTLESGGPEHVVERPFAVVADTVTVAPKRTLALVQDLKDQDSTLASEFSDRALLAVLEQWTDRVERYCRARLTPVRETVKVRYRPSTSAFLKERLYGLASFTDEGSSIAVPLTSLEVRGYTDRSYGNPRVDFSSRTYTAGRVEWSYAAIDGVWGNFDDETLSTAIDIVAVTSDAIVRILLDAYGQLNIPIGVIKREKTDGHEIEYATISTKVRTGMMSAMKSPELMDILAHYRSPIGVEMTGGF